MNRDLRTAIDEAFLYARQALGVKSLQQAYPWLERVHILSQQRPVFHAYCHWLMFQAGWVERDYREMLGQVPRILAALLFSKVWVPEGNTGRARVSAFRPMPISAELKQLLQGNRR